MRKSSPQGRKKIIKKISYKNNRAKIKKRRLKSTRFESRKKIIIKLNKKRREKRN